MSNYPKEYYKVPNDVGRIVEYKGRKGVICRIEGQYVNVNFDDNDPGSIAYFHPHSDGLKYLEMGGTIRKMSRSKKRYQDWQRSDCSESFSEWIKGRMYLAYEKA